MEGFSTDAQAACCFRCSASKRTPFFQTSKVIAAIFRASVRRGIKVLERPGDGSSPYGRSLKDIFQIVVMVLVEPADGQEFLGAFDLTFHETVLPTSRPGGARRLR